MGPISIHLVDPPSWQPSKPECRLTGYPEQQESRNCERHPAAHLVLRLVVNSVRVPSSCPAALWRRRTLPESKSQTNPDVYQY